MKNFKYLFFITIIIIFGITVQASLYGISEGTYHKLTRPQFANFIGSTRGFLLFNLYINSVYFGLLGIVLSFVYRYLTVKKSTLVLWGSLYGLWYIIFLCTWLYCTYYKDPDGLSGMIIAKIIHLSKFNTSHLPSFFGLLITVISSILTCLVSQKLSKFLTTIPK